MSFSGEVKEELSRQFATGRHCQIAEIALRGFKAEKALECIQKIFPWLASILC